MKRQNQILTIIISLIILLAPASLSAQRKMEKLGRGTVAIRKSNTSVFVSWRILGTEFDNETTYNLYRDNTLIASNLTVSNYTDNNSANSTYKVGAVVNGIEQKSSPETAIQSSFVTSIPLKDIGDYYVHLAWVGDLDGDGEYEYVVDRIPNTAEPTCKVEAYKKDGTRLWQIDMGPLSVDRNGIEGGAATLSNGMWDGVTVYDLDLDGKAEVVIKTANGTKFADGNTVTYSSDIQNFLSVIDGETGAEKSRIALPSNYLTDGPLQAQLNIAYLDGVHPSVVVKAKNRVGSGGFNMVIAAYDYNGTITQRWKWLRGNQNSPEFHQQRIVDVDLDGKDEICDGGYVIDDDGTVLYTLGDQGVVHGDRFQIGDFDPDRPGLEGYGIQQDNPSGLAWYYYDAKDGSFIQTQYMANIGDYARGNMADIDPNHTGYEMWTFTDGIYNVQDGKITNNITGSYPNIRLWWDGDLQSEMLDGVKFLKWNYTNNYDERILTASQYGATYTWRNVPVLYGDIMGDWREEVVYEKSDHTALLIFNTTDATSERIYTLAHNPEYRLCMSTKGYYQSAQLDFYLGTDMPTPPIPAMQSATSVWGGLASDIWNTTDNNWDRSGTYGAYAANDSVLFGIQGTTHTEVAINETVSPAITYVISPIDYTFSGTGELAGDGSLIKSGYSTLSLNINTNNRGLTKVEQGTLLVNGTINSSDVVVYGGANLGGNGTITMNSTFEKRAHIMPGEKGKTGTLTFNKAVSLVSGVVCDFDITNDSTNLTKPSDKLIVENDLTLNSGVIFEINAIDEEIKPGLYPLITYNGQLTGNLSSIVINGLFGKKIALLDTLNTITLKIFSTRDNSLLTWEGSAPMWDMQKHDNWLLGGQKDKFVAGDSVVFDASGTANSIITLVGELPVGKITINGDDVRYRFVGNGIMGGEGDLVKNDNGSVQFSTTSNTYTGKTIINGGTLIAEKVDIAGVASSIGANPSTAYTQFVMNDATFNYKSPANSYTDKGMFLNGVTDTIEVNRSGSTLSVSGLLAGNAGLVKTGAGTLYLLGATNNYKGGTVIKEGAIQLNDPGSSQDVKSLGNGLITFEGGRLIMGNTSGYTTCSMDFFVDKDNTGTLEADKRCNYDGKLTGEGTLNVVLPGTIDRTIFRGNWSEFKGIVTVSGASPMRLASGSGYKNMTFNLASGMAMYYSGGTSGGDAVAQTVHIGGLKGATDSYLNGENWVIGEANDTTTFNGVINGNSIAKVGDGMLILTNANTYKGGTKISGGKLVANNTTGSATGTGNVSINNGGTLDGTGIIGSSITVNSGGILEFGEQLGSLTVNKAVTMATESTMKVDINSLTARSDKLNTGANKLSLNGTLVINNLATTAFFAGAQYTIFTGVNITGQFESIEPATPGDGLQWDISELYTKGVLRISVADAIEEIDATKAINIYPNPVTDILNISFSDDLKVVSILIKNTSGQTCIKNLSGENQTIDMTLLPTGIYIVEIRTVARLLTKKVVKY